MNFKVKFLNDCPSVSHDLATWFDEQWGKDPLDRYEPSLERLKGNLNSDCIPFTLVGFADGKPVATACLQESMMAVKRPFGPWVAYVYVLPELRGKNLGAKIMNVLENEARRIGFRNIYLNTAFAEPFYTKLGWEAIEELTEPRGVVMKKSIAV